MGFMREIWQQRKIITVCRGKSFLDRRVNYSCILHLTFLKNNYLILFSMSRGKIKESDM